MPRIVLSTVVAAPAQECFQLSLSVDAHATSMAAHGERVVAADTSGVMSLGQAVTWEARHFGVPFRMTVRITACDPPRRFVDEQVRGPFAIWRHEHHFDEVDGTTTVTDVVDYRSPAGAFGHLLDRLFLQRYLTRLLQRRNDWLKREIERE